MTLDMFLIPFLGGGALAYCWCKLSGSTYRFPIKRYTKERMDDTLKDAKESVEGVAQPEERTYLSETITGLEERGVKIRVLTPEKMPASGGPNEHYWIIDGKKVCVEPFHPRNSLPGRILITKEPYTIENAKTYFDHLEKQLLN